MAVFVPPPGLQANPKRGARLFLSRIPGLSAVAKASVGYNFLAASIGAGQYFSTFDSIRTPPRPTSRVGSNHAETPYFSTHGKFSSYRSPTLKVKLRLNFQSAWMNQSFVHRCEYLLSGPYDGAFVSLSIEPSKKSA